MQLIIKTSINLKHITMTEFKPIYTKEKLLLTDKDFLADIIISQERDIHNLHEEKISLIKEWKESLKSR
tara:strand:+ start:42 stop:248 length:207 start_codon:yes stop_codon:yes gene_type:complete